jgi:hypothetical protein
LGNFVQVSETRFGMHAIKFSVCEWMMERYSAEFLPVEHEFMSYGGCERISSVVRLRCKETIMECVERLWAHEAGMCEVSDV